MFGWIIADKNADTEATLRLFESATAAHAALTNDHANLHKKISNIYNCITSMFRMETL